MWPRVLPLLSPLLLILLVVITTAAAQKVEDAFSTQDFNEIDRQGAAIGERNNFLEWLLSLAGLTTTTPRPNLEPPTDCPPCVCGKINKVRRIVGGQETQVNQYPWMALLLSNGDFYCGGTLINDRYVMTAAHCVKGFKQEKMAVRLLEHNRKIENETKTITRKVSRVVYHSGYSNINYNNDIAVLQLDEKVDLTDGKLRPVCMPAVGRSFTHYDGIVTGWGATEQNGPVAAALQEVTVPIISNVECKETEYGDRITDNMLCAGFPEGGKDSCQGDSGGPLHIHNMTTDSYDLVGVVSWGEGCAQKDHPGVYTRVNRYLTWTKTHTRDACYCQ